MSDDISKCILGDIYPWLQQIQEVIHVIRIRIQWNRIYLWPYYYYSSVGCYWWIQSGEPFQWTRSRDSKWTAMEKIYTWPSSSLDDGCGTTKNSCLISGTSFFLLLLHPGPLHPYWFLVTSATFLATRMVRLFPGTTRIPSTFIASLPPPSHIDPSPLVEVEALHPVPDLFIAPICTYYWSVDTSPSQCSLYRSVLRLLLSAAAQLCPHITHRLLLYLYSYLMELYHHTWWK